MLRHSWDRIYLHIYIYVCACVSFLTMTSSDTFNTFTNLFLCTCVCVRLPKIPETRGRRGKLIVFETTDIDTSSIPYQHKERETARYIWCDVMWCNAMVMWWQKSIYNILTSNSYCFPLRMLHILIACHFSSLMIIHFTFFFLRMSGPTLLGCTLHPMTWLIFSHFLPIPARSVALTISTLIPLPPISV